MPIYISLLRGINVSGQKSIKMEQLRVLFERLGFKKIQTYIQSGNVVFSSPPSPPQKLSQKVRDKILKEFGFSVSVLTLSAVDLKKTIQKNPFLKEKKVDPAQLHVTFLSETPSKASLKALQDIPSGPDQLACSTRVIYLFCPKGYGKTKLSNTAIEKALDLEATTRNWRTVNELYRLTQSSPAIEE